MTENLATPTRDGLAPSILAPKKRLTVPVWVLAVSVVAAFALGWMIPGPAQNAPVESTAAPSATASPEPEVDTEDDSAFVRVANRDLGDFGDDLDDLDVTLDEDGFWRLLSNTVELNFNLSQLQSHKAPKSIEGDWSDGLSQLADDIDAIESGITSASDTKVRAAIADARDTLQGLLDVTSRVD